MKKDAKTKKGNLLEIEGLRIRLEEAGETLSAIRRGEVDGLVVSGPKGDQVFTLEGAERSYRFFVEAMNEGAVTLAFDGTILYCNDCFAEMVAIPHKKIIGGSIRRFISSPEEAFEPVFQKGKTERSKAEIILKGKNKKSIPVSVSFNPMQEDEVPGICMVITDLTMQKQGENEIRKAHDELEIRVQDRTQELTKANKELQSEITERKEAEQSLHKSEARFKVLSETAGKLLATENPQGIVNELCRKVMAHLDCQAFFNFLVDEVAGKLHLNACAGIPEGEARKIEWLDFGVAVCGCVARDGFPIVAEDILHVPDVRTDLVKSYGIQAYACHPLKVEDCLIGTLSFGTKTRPSFSPEDLALMRTVTDQVATAMERMRLIKEIQRSREDLERRVQERTEELAKSQNRLQNLSSQLLLAQEIERKRVAAELHDGLMSELAATKYLLEGKINQLDQGRAPNSGELKRITDILANAMKEARRIMNNLHPSVLDELGLIAAISWLCAEYQNSYPHIRVQKEIRVPEDGIPFTRKGVIFRILQEALNNFAKHGKGDLMELSLLKSGDVLHLKIQDNGHGFDVDRVEKGLGLDSMQERVEISGGSFHIESVIGQGTTIRAIWSI